MTLVKYAHPLGWLNWFLWGILYFNIISLFSQGYSSMSILELTNVLKFTDTVVPMKSECSSGLCIKIAYIMFRAK